MDSFVVDSSIVEKYFAVTIGGDEQNVKPVKFCLIACVWAVLSFNSTVEKVFSVTNAGDVQNVKPVIFCPIACVWAIVEKVHFHCSWR